MRKRLTWGERSRGALAARARSTPASNAPRGRHRRRSPKKGSGKCSSRSLLTPICRTCLVSRPIPRVHKTLGEMDNTNENKEVHFLDESLSAPADEFDEAPEETRAGWLVPAAHQRVLGPAAPDHAGPLDVRPAARPGPHPRPHPRARDVRAPHCPLGGRGLGAGLAALPGQYLSLRARGSTHAHRAGLPLALAAGPQLHLCRNARPGGLPQAGADQSSLQRGLRWAQHRPVRRRLPRDSGRITFP